MRCAMTDREYPEFADGIYSDGVWVSWDWYYHQINEQNGRHDSQNMLSILPNSIAHASWKIACGK